MLFNSIPFLFFFIIVTGSYFALPHKLRWLLLLIASCVFYMAFVPVYLLILGITISVDYVAGIMIENAGEKKKRLFLVLSVAANIGMLCAFKYYNFINVNVTALISQFYQVQPLPYLSLLLPIGLSFHTFQSISYIVEVYRGRQQAERHAGIFALYVLFYPQLVAGPIERPQNMLHQFYEEHRLDYVRITDGLKLIAWGLFKKIVIADRLGILVDNVYNDPFHHKGLSFVIATVFFSFQIFCDFSGYSDMAIGIAKVMGFRLTANFNSPYHAASVQEFWKRWHISLSSWFRDYVYRPLGGSRVDPLRHCLNVLIVFLLSGLWHGANWTFVAWGALHATYMIGSVVAEKLKARWPVLNTKLLPTALTRVPGILTTFILVSFAWIFFRAKTIATALYIVRSIFTETRNDLYNFFHGHPSQMNLGLGVNELAIAVFSILVLETVHLIRIRYDLLQTLRTFPPIIRWTVYYAAVFILLTLNVSGTRQFIYFQF